MTCPACAHPRVTLHDGTETCTWSESWRHECEARHVVNMPAKYLRQEYLAAIRRRRGDAAADALADMIKTIWYAR